MDCLFLPPAFDPANADRAPLYWLRADADGQALSLSECAIGLAQRPVALVLPAELATSLLVELPTRKARWLRQALPFAVEDMLAEEVDLFHLALGEQVADGRHRVFALSRHVLSTWLLAVESVGIVVASLHLDADLLPRDDLQALSLGERILVGGEAEVRLAFPSQLWPQMLDLCEGVRLQEGVGNPYALLAQGRAHAVDLAQGDFARADQDSPWLGWRPLALAVLCSVVVQLVFNVAQAWYLQHQAQGYTEASLALYRELFPGDLRIVNLKAQFAEHLNQGATGGNDMLTMLEPVARAIAESKSPLTVQQVDFSRSRGDLALQVRAADFSVFEQLRQRLSAQGLSVQLGSASREEQGVTARVVLGGGA